MATATFVPDGVSVQLLTSPDDAEAEANAAEPETTPVKVAVKLVGLSSFASVTSLPRFETREARSITTPLETIWIVATGTGVPVVLGELGTVPAEVVDDPGAVVVGAGGAVVVVAREAAGELQPPVTASPAPTMATAHSLFTARSRNRRR